MIRITRKQYPVARLPDDLRVLSDPSKTATLVIDQDVDASVAPEQTFMRDFGAAKGLNTSVESAVERIRALRDDTDDVDDRIHDPDRRS